MKKVILIIFITLSLNSFAQTNVIGGVATSENEFPFMAMLEYDSEGPCGGVLIAPNLVLTAGHCILGDPPDYEYGPTGVKVNLHRMSKPHSETESRSIDTIYIHRSFNMDNFGSMVDLAIIKLDEPSSHGPIDMAAFDEDSLYENGTIASILGWGITDTASFSPSDTLRIGQVKLLDNDTCYNRYGTYVDSFPISGTLNIDSFCFCGEPVDSSVNSGAAIGDSGGPLFKQVNGEYKLIGIVSGGLTYQTTFDHPGIHMKINELRPWIDSIIRIANSPATNVNEAGNISKGIHLKTAQTSSSLIINLRSTEISEEQFDLKIFNQLGQVIYEEGCSFASGSHQIIINKEILNCNLGVIAIRGKNGWSLTKKVFLHH